ncbi:MAG: methyl-accepting chemotaxis protein [Planctomycetaceae bacterium]|nr:methyl-accepting chemotaxis protein [Planctomycetaceae bacterium]
MSRTPLIPLTNLFRMGIRFKLLSLTIFVTIVLIGVVVTFSSLRFAAFVASSIEHNVQSVSRDVEYELDIFKSMALVQTQSLSYNLAVINATKSKDREAILKIYQDLKLSPKVEFLTVVDPKGIVILRSSNPAKFGDSLGAAACVHHALEKGEANVGYESTKGIPMSIRAAAPIYDLDGKTLLGIISCGFRLDSKEWVKYLHDKYNAYATTFVGKLRYVTTILDPATGEPAAGTELDSEPIIKTVYDEGKVYHGDAMIFGQPFKVCYIPAKDSAGKTIGAVFAGFPLAELRAEIRHNVVSCIAIAAVGTVIFAVLISILVTRIVGPIRQMTAAANSLAVGNLDIDIDVRSKDELGILSQAFTKVAESLKMKCNVAVQIAKGDLTTWVPLASPKDALGIAFIDMRYAFYDSLKDLTKLAATIHSEGDQLEQNNERLVANSTESASQLKAVSGDVAKLDRETQESSKGAAEAEKHSEDASKGVIAGRDKMSKMVEAMNAITKSSNEIKNIIKVIDDIAFQTNLLALNAAVEAARAGTHGKGFAVVAEEVRNLAARSAKAAKETAALIEQSIGQVSVGGRIAGETSESLNQIAEQVQEVTVIIANLSEQSAKQAQTLREVNTAVSQIVDTVTHTTETITEDAGAVQSLAVTARQLEKITQHFTTNDTGKVTVPSDDPGFLPVRDTHHPEGQHNSKN